MFIDNKYTQCYYRIVDNRKANPLTGYSEKHHIIPKSLGGNNKKENLVSLTAREHFVTNIPAGWIPGRSFKKGGETI